MVVDLKARQEEVGSWDLERGGVHEMPAQMQYVLRWKVAYVREK